MQFKTFEEWEAYIRGLPPGTVYSTECWKPKGIFIVTVKEIEGKTVLGVADAKK